MRVMLVSMEILVDKLPTYAGGMGILSGDFLLSASELGYNVYGVTFVYNKGYVEYEMEENKLVPREEEYDPIEFLKLEREEFKINTREFPIYFRVWSYKLGKNKVFFIDTNVPENPKELRNLTSRLYIENSLDEKILKYILLGLGSLEISEKLGLKIDKFHLNEAHAGFLPVELYKRLGEIEKIREKVVYTNHTVLAHAHEEFDYNLVEKYYEIPQRIKEISGDKFRPYRILWNLSSKFNCVSWKHRMVYKRVFPESDPIYITNGVHHVRWVSDEIAGVFDEYLPGWRENPSLLSYAGIIPLKELERAKKNSKELFVEYINSNAYLTREFDTNGIILTVRRRFTEYKRITMPIWDKGWIEYLSRKYDVQILFSGVAHPKDQTAREEMKRILDAMSSYDVKIALIPRRGVVLERFLISGSDLWLHTSKPPLEACGTSWMRAGINGVPSLSSRDGGVIEIIKDGYNGWLFGEDSYDWNYPNWGGFDDFKRKMEEIAWIYREDRERYLDVCRNAIKTIGPLFNSHRMVKEYFVRLYM